MEIINARAQDAPQLKTLFEAAFGSHYLSTEQILDYIRGGTPFKLAVEGDALLGAILFIPAGEAEVAAHVHMDPAAVRRLSGGKPCLLCKCACTADGLQGTGIGKQILSACLADIAAGGYGAVFTVLWKYNGAIPAESLFAGFGFVRGRALTMPWYQDAGYVCSICKGRCRCDGVVYYKSIEKEGSTE